MNDDEIGKEFIRLAFLVDKIYGGRFPEDTAIVDSYFVVDKDGKPKYVPSEYYKKDFEVDVSQLVSDLKSLKRRASELPEPRASNLEDIINSLIIIANKEKFEAMSFKEAAKKVYWIDIDKRLLTGELARWRGELQDLLSLQGYTESKHGSWSEAVDEWAKANYVPSSRIKSSLEGLRDMMRAIFRKSAGKYKRLYDLMKMEIEGVSGVSWRAYNYYLGHEAKYKGKISINTDYKNTLLDLYSLATHEMFPGHQTHNSIIQYQYLKGDLGLESTMLLVHTPDCVVGEGIGDLGESSENLKNALGFNKKEKNMTEGEKKLKMKYETSAKLRDLERSIYTYAALKHGTDKSAITDCMRDEGYLPVNLAKQRTGFLTDPFWGKYLVTYKYGFELMSKQVKKLKGGKIIIDEEVYDKIYSQTLPAREFEF